MFLKRKTLSTWFLILSFIFFLLPFFYPKTSLALYTLCQSPCRPGNIYWDCMSPYVCYNSICLKRCPVSAYCRSSTPNCSCLREYRGCTGYYCPCSSNAPLAPTNINVQITPNYYDLPNSTIVSWNFGSNIPGTSGCGNTDWGWVCNGENVGTNSNSFRIKVNDKVVTTVDQSTRSTTINLTTWGSNKITVCAFNGAVESCATASDSPTLISPSPYPTIVITGALRQKSSETDDCPVVVSPNFLVPTVFTVTPASPNCITPVCNALPNSSTARGFSCSIKFDNIGCQVAPNYLKPTPSQEFTLNVYFKGLFSPGQWTEASSSACTPVNRKIDINILEPTPIIIKEVVANFNEHWIKLKDAAFVRTLTTTNNLPPAPLAFDSDDNATKKYFILGNAGSALGIDVGEYGTFSETKNWGSKTYTPQIQKFSAGVFIDYMQSRKNYNPITSLSNLENGINYFDGDLEINDENKNIFNNKKAVLVLAKNKTLTLKFETDGKFSPINASIMFLATNINLNASVIQLDNTILISDNFMTGKGENSLKINGNLNVQKSFNFNRNVGNNAKPSIFIYFKINPYIELLPYLSTSVYDWKQIQ